MVAVSFPWCFGSCALAPRLAVVVRCLLASVWAVVVVLGFLLWPFWGCSGLCCSGPRRLLPLATYVMLSCTGSYHQSNIVSIFPQHLGSSRTYSQPVSQGTVVIGRYDLRRFMLKIYIARSKVLHNVS